MSVLFAHQSPALVQKIITLDHRRMPLPRTKSPKIYSLRSNDFSADEGVLPTPAEEKQFEMTIVKVDIKHGDMNDAANEVERAVLRHWVVQFLKS
jgi:hypothetical protein